MVSLAAPTPPRWSRSPSRRAVTSPPSTSTTACEHRPTTTPMSPQAIAERLGADFRVSRVSVAAGSNLEARARTARRAALGPDAMTGHTADDQAETLLLALLRGAGATGLGAIRPGRRHPILALRRAETRSLCTRLGLVVAEDPSNHDPRFRRNRIRHEVLPLLDDVAERDVTVLLARTADLLRADDQFLDELAAGIDPTDAPALVAAPTRPGCPGDPSLARARRLPTRRRLRPASTGRRRRRCRRVRAVRWTACGAARQPPASRHDASTEAVA